MVSQRTGLVHPPKGNRAAKNVRARAIKDTDAAAHLDF